MTSADTKPPPCRISLPGENSRHPPCARALASQRALAGRQPAVHTRAEAPFSVRLLLRGNDVRCHCPAGRADAARGQAMPSRRL